jgi:hypothetical protein
VVQQDAAPAPVCEYAVAPSSRNVGAGSSSSAFTISTGPACQWTASVDNGWVALSRTSGTGPAEVAYAVEANTTTSTRTATISAQGQTHTVVQEAAAPVCTFTVQPPARGFPATGGSATFTMVTSPGCGWSAASNADWVTVTTGSGSGQAEVAYTVQANATTATRTAAITAGGQTHTVTQEAAAPPCTFALNPPSRSFTASGGDGQFTVETQSHCQWSATSAPSWVTMSPAGATGSGSVSYSVQANTTQSQRTGSISVNGQSHAITQDAAAAPPPPALACTFSIDPTERNVDSAGGFGTVRVSTEPSCAWAVTPGAEWVRLVGDGTTGPGQVGYLIVPNLTGASRNTVVTIAGRAFTVRQQ